MQRIPIKICVGSDRRNKEAGKARRVTVAASACGVWAAHGAVGWDSDVPDDVHFVVTHMPTGRTIAAMTGFLNRAEAMRIAKALAEKCNPKSMEEAKQRRDEIISTIDEVMSDFELTPDEAEQSEKAVAK